MRFLKNYLNALAYTVAILVAVSSVTAPVILWVVLENPLWLLLYIVLIPLFAAIVTWLED